MTLTELVHNYHKKHGLVPVDVEHVQHYSDGSSNTLHIESVIQEKELYDPDEKEYYTAQVLTRKLRVVHRGSSSGDIDWFDGRTFNTLKGAQNAIDREKVG